MTFDVSSLGSAKTPGSYLDSTRPKEILDAEKIFKRLTLEFSNSGVDAVNIMSTVAAEIQKTQIFDAEELLPRLSRKLLGAGKNINMKAEDGLGQVLTAFSLFYPALERADAEPFIQNVSALNNLYFEVRNYMSSRFNSKLSGSDKRGLERIMRTLDNRFSKVAERFNQSVDEGTIAGPKIPV